MKQLYVHTLTQIVGKDAETGEPVKEWKSQLCDDVGREAIDERGRDNDDRLFVLTVDDEGTPTIGEEV